MHKLKTLIFATAICLLFAGSSYAQGSAGAGAAKEAAVDVPMLFRGPSPAVEVMVNGKGPFIFAIDTGAQGSARVDSSLVEKLGLKPAGQIQAGDGSGMSTRTMDIIKLDSLAVGNLRFQNVEAPTRNYNMNPNAPHVDGIIGFNLFADYLLTLDFPAKRVRVERGELPKADEKEVLSYDGSRGIPIIEMSVGSLKVNAHIDSGNMSGGVVVPESLVQQLQLASEPKVVGKAKTVSNEFEIKEAALKGSVRLGRYEFNDPLITFAPIFRDANVGAKMLGSFTLTFDQKNHRVRFIRKDAAG
ncbi:MAG: retropepsin-like aspartic protease [Pyrinomonadaceae bacterium]